jgi:CDGSH-type Zn-finger protein
MRQSGSRQDIQSAVDRIVMKVVNTPLFVRDVEAAHQVGILSGNTYGATVGVAFKSLNTAQREHHRPGRVAKVCGNGNAFDLGDKETIALCRCGASASRPFCDGSHRDCGFESAETAS